MKLIYLVIIYLLPFTTSAQSDISLLYNKYKNENHSEDAFIVLNENKGSVINSNNIEILNTYISISRSFLKDFPLPDSESDKFLDIAVQRQMVMNGILPRALSARAQIKVSKSDYYGAIEDWKEAISYYPGDDTAFDSKIYYYNIGICLWNLKQYQKACLSMSKSGELGYEDAYKFIKEKCN